MRRCLIALTTMGLAACAAPKPEPEVADANVTRKCYKEYRVGSNIPVMNCSESLSEADRQRMIDELKHVFRPAAPGAAGSGG